MTVTLKIGVGDLLPKFLANALILLSMFHSARAITACAFQSLFNYLNHFLIFIQFDCHKNHSFCMIIGVFIPSVNGINCKGRLEFTLLV